MTEYEYTYISLVEADDIIRSYIEDSEGQKPFLALWDYGGVDAFELVCLADESNQGAFAYDHVYLTPDDAELLVDEFDLDVVDCRD